MLSHKKSQKLFETAQKKLVGGVNSPVRAFKSVGGDPLFISKAKGPWIWDADGNRYCDFVGSWGPMILGHAHPATASAARAQILKGSSFGAPTELEIELAELVTGAFPSIQKVRFVSSGTEAVMSAVRLARGFTRRNKVIKFSGCYHGHSDGFLTKAGSGAATLGVPDSFGVPESFSRETIVLPYNDMHRLQSCFQDQIGEIAVVIVEPVAGNMGVVAPSENFLAALRMITQRTGSVLIFDEVITGFRAAYGGAQEVFGIRPDLTCLGKIIGGGFPVGAFGGRTDIMDKLAPLGPVYQAGTLSGNPVAMSAGIATLTALKRDKPYAKLEKRTKAFADAIQAHAKKTGLPLEVNRFGSMFTAFFTDQPVRDFDSAKRSDTKKYAAFFHALLEEGIYFPPAQFEAAFISAAHDENLLKKCLAGTLRALDKARQSN